MKLLILGATGGTGRLLVEQALAKGHDVTALVRDPAAVKTQHPKLKVVAGRVTVAAELDPVVAGQDAVLGALGARAKTDRICPDAAKVLIPAMQAHGVKRVVWLSAGGVGDSRAAVTDASWFFGRILLPLLFEKPYAHHAEAEALFRASGLDWTIPRPLQLVEKPIGKTPVAALPGAKITSLKISRHDTAAFMLHELEARAWVGQLPLLFA